VLRETFSALECFIKSAQGSEGSDAAIDSISKPISAINACAAAALIELEQSSWMQGTFGSLSRSFVSSLEMTIGRCCELISHLIASLESHVAIPNDFFETNAMLPFILEQCSSALTLLRTASAACAPSSSSFASAATPHPLDVSHIAAYCSKPLSLPENASLLQEHSSYVKFCADLNQFVLQIKGHLTLPIPPNTPASQEMARSALSAQAVVTQVMQTNRSVCKMLLTLANLGLDLSTNGFCKPQEQEEGSDEGEGEGTGMGQGQGREDVSEEIENEGQMEGLQGEENKDPQVSFPSFYDAGRVCV
jgi:hypothetical protein